VNGADKGVRGSRDLPESSPESIGICEILSSNSGGLAAGREGKVERRIEEGEGVI
jgi:hypothetical protein